MRFDRHSALDLLADALRRADATWRGGEIVPWDDVSEGQQREWRAVALRAATAVYEEVSADSPRVATD